MIRNTKARAGFTLLELLVVIAIIGILATIIMPTVGRLQGRAREVQCTSNLRQLHTAAISYAQNGGHLPRAYAISIETADGTQEGQRRAWVASVTGSDIDAQGHAWWYEKNGDEGTHSITNGTLFGYVNDTSVYVCPTMARLARSELAGDRKQVVRSYGMNVRMSRARLQRITGASRKMLFADQGFQDIGQGRNVLTGDDDGDDDEGEEGGEDLDEDELFWRRYNTRVDGAIDAGYGVANSRAEWIGAYHGPQAGEIGPDGGRANVVFVDGHTEQVEYVYTDEIAHGDWEDGAPIE